MIVMVLGCFRPVICLDYNPFPEQIHPMSITVEQVAHDALGLPIDGRAQLVEQLLASLAGEAAPAVERAHLDEIRRRRDAVRTGQASLVDGPEAHRQVRAALRK